MTAFPLMCSSVCTGAVFVFILSADFHVPCFSMFHVFAFLCVHVYLCLIVRPLSPSLAPSQLTGVSVSPGKDQLVVFHTKDNRDLVVCLQGMVPASESRIGELVGALLSHFKR